MAEPPVLLRVLLVEDSPRDAELLMLALEAGTFTPVVQRVETPGALQQALSAQVWDVILADYHMPEFSGLAALRLVQEHGRDIPVIIVSGTVGEEVAVAAMKAGAHDYVMKDQLARLLPAIDREVREAEGRRERREAEAALRASEARYRSLVETSLDAIVLSDLHGLVLMANPQAAVLYGYPSPAGMQGIHAETLIAAEERSRAQTSFWAVVVERGQIRDQQYRACRHDGATFPVEMSGAVIVGVDGRPDGVLTVTRDITERLQFQEQLAHQALHDALTGLPNRTLLHDRVASSIRTAHRQDTPLALLLTDLDRFKEINDTFGHEVGDVVLQEVATRLQGVVRDIDTVARLGGDEFAVVLPGTDEREATLVALRLVSVLAHPVVVNERRLDIGTSVGIACYGAHGTDATTLLRAADVAMYAAKRRGDAYAVYAADNDRNSVHRLTLIAELRRAIDHDELELHYQPKVDLRTGNVTSVEALARWQHPTRGFIPPDEFIPLAEHTGLIKPLTRWVLNEALRQCRDWYGAGHPIDVAVNLSAWSLYDPEFVETVRTLLDRWAVAPASLELELTESMVMTDPLRARETLTQLHALGVQLSIDDFGTGYSSLGYLKRLPVQQLKIDKSFVMQMASNDDDAFIARAIVDLSHNLGLEVVAEGVEERQTLRLLTMMGCDLAQGYYVSRPLLPGELLGWLQQTKTAQTSVATSFGP